MSTTSRRVRADVLLGLGLLVVGVLVGLTWRALLPLAARWADVGEASIAREGMLATIGAVTGLLVAVWLLARPGASPVRRVAVGVLGSVLGAWVAWGVGRLAGAPVLRAPGAAFVWPVTTAAVVFVYTAVSAMFAPRRSGGVAATHEGGDSLGQSHEVSR